MRALLAVTCLALLSAGFAGCLEDKERYPNGVPTTTSTRTGTTTATGSVTSTGTGSSTATSTGPGGNETANQAPTGSIEVAVNGTNATFKLGGADLDNDTLEWSLDFGDGNQTNGTTLPTTVTHQYAVTGNLTATYSVTDGKDNATYDVEVSVGAGGGQPLFSHEEGTAAPGNPMNSLQLPVGWCGASCCASFNAGMSGADCIFFEIGAELEGHTFTLTADAGNPDMEFWASCDPAELASLADYRNDGPETGEVVGGAGCVVAWDDGGGGDTPTFTFVVA